MQRPPAAEGVLSDEYVYQYAYRRALGPVIGRFFGALRDGRIEGVRTASGRVIVPPTEHDPDTGEATTDFVEVGPGGVVTTWSWCAAPRPWQPLGRPFAWALVKLDGADTPLLHAVDVASEAAIRTGMRVRARFREERGNGMLDIACFEPEEAR